MRTASKIEYGIPTVVTNDGRKDDLGKPENYFLRDLETSWGDLALSRRRGLSKKNRPEKSSTVGYPCVYPLLFSLPNTNSRLLKDNPDRNIFAVHLEKTGIVF